MAVCILVLALLLLLVSALLALYSLPLTQWASVWSLQSLLRGRGPDGLCLALLLHAALHAAVNQAWAAQSERLRTARA